jgi:uncharacterized protein
MFALLLVGAPLRAEPALPPKPARHFNDYAKVVPADVGQRIDARLAAFERETSNQVLVAVFPKLPDGTFLEDYTVKAAESWGAGGKEKDNGIILFVFVADRKLRIEVGYGLEGVVPDSIAASIIWDVITPRFKQGDYGAGIEQGVEAIFKATRNEYKGTGRTLAEGQGAGEENSWPGLFALLMFGALFFWIRRRVAGAERYSRGSRHGGPMWFPVGGGGFGGGGGGGGSFGGFSGGGGSFGGGGSSGDW